MLNKVSLHSKAVLKEMGSSETIALIYDFILAKSILSP
jgi:hypothetical protein